VVTSSPGNRRGGGENKKVIVPLGRSVWSVGGGGGVLRKNGDTVGASSLHADLGKGRRGGVVVGLNLGKRYCGSTQRRKIRTSRLSGARFQRKG